jgi:hypothetical protein
MAVAFRHIISIDVGDNCVNRRQQERIGDHMGCEWQDGEMRDGIRKVLNKRESKRSGKVVYSWKVPYRDANGKQTSATFDDLGKAKVFRNKVRNMRDEG